MVSPMETQFICSFHKHSLIVPVSSAIKALATLAEFPNLVTTGFGPEISRILAFRLTLLIPVRKSLIGRDCAFLYFLARYLRIMSVCVNFLIGLFCAESDSVDIGNWATTSEPFKIRNVALSCVLPRHSIERPPHVDF